MRKAKNNTYKLNFPCLGTLDDLKLILYTDASYANLSDRVSSAGGHIIFLMGINGKCCPILWSFEKIKRVVKSTLAAEALSLVEGLDACYFIRIILSYIINCATQSISHFVKTFIRRK